MNMPSNLTNAPVIWPNVSPVVSNPVKLLPLDAEIVIGSFQVVLEKCALFRSKSEKDNAYDSPKFLGHNEARLSERFGFNYRSNT